MLEGVAPRFQITREDVATVHDKLKVALVGCGQIADAHLQRAGRTGLARVVAVCDREPDVAHQAAVRFGVPTEYHDVDRMLQEVEPDVVHVTAPPAAHADLLRKSVDAGAHVYVEKPFALTLEETEYMLAVAAARSRLVCVGHDRLFDPVWIELCEQIDAGAIGEVAHVECVQLYDLNGGFGRVALNEPGHWVQRLPGGLFQNTLPHHLAAIAELLPESNPSVTAVAWTRDGLERPTELQVLVHGARVTAALTFLTTSRPPGSYVRIYGTSGWLEGDYEARVVRRRQASSLPSLLAKFAVPLRASVDSAHAFVRNAVRFARADLQYFSGMQAVMHAFYLAVLEGRPSPTPPESIHKVSAMMDAIVRACMAGDDTRHKEAAPALHL